jgi:hypothetical protein
VKQAISILGTGFLSHPDNPQIRGRLDPRNADLKLDDFNRALLRLVYRLLFWFVAEDRDALLQPYPDGASPEAAARMREARDRYATYFSSARLRQLARRHRGGQARRPVRGCPARLRRARHRRRRARARPWPASAASSNRAATTAGRCRSTSPSPAPGSPTKRCSARCARSRW